MADDKGVLGGASALDEVGLAYVSNGVRAIFKATGLTDERAAVALSHLTPAQLFVVKAGTKLAPGLIAWSMAKIPKSVFVGFKNPEVVSKFVARGLEEFAEKLEEMVEQHGGIEKAPVAVRDAAVQSAIAAGLDLKGKTLKSDGVLFHMPDCAMVTLVLKNDQRPPPFNKGRDNNAPPPPPASKTTDVAFERAHAPKHEGGLGLEPCPNCLKWLLFDAKAAEADRKAAEAAAAAAAKPAEPEKKPVSQAALLQEFFAETADGSNQRRWSAARKGLTKKDNLEFVDHFDNANTIEEIRGLLPAMEAGGRVLHDYLRAMRDFNEKIRIGVEGKKLARDGVAFAKSVDANHIGPFVDKLNGRRPKKAPAPYNDGWAILGIAILLLSLLPAGWAEYYDKMVLALVSVTAGFAVAVVCGAMHMLRSRAASNGRGPDDDDSDAETYDWRILGLPFALLGKAYRIMVSAMRRSVGLTLSLFAAQIGLMLWFSERIEFDGVRWTAFASGIFTLVNGFVILWEITKMLAILKVGGTLVGQDALVTKAHLVEAKGWAFSTIAWCLAVDSYLFFHPYLDPTAIGGLALLTGFFAAVRITPWFDKPIFRPFVYGFAVIIVSLLLVEWAAPVQVARASRYVQKHTGIQLLASNPSVELLRRKLLKEQKEIEDEAALTESGDYVDEKARARDKYITETLYKISEKGNDFWAIKNGAKAVEPVTHSGTAPTQHTATSGLIPQDVADDILRELEAAEASQ